MTAGCWITVNEDKKIYLDVLESAFLSRNKSLKSEIFNNNF